MGFYGNDRFHQHKRGYQWELPFGDEKIAPFFSDDQNIYRQGEAPQ